MPICTIAHAHWCDTHRPPSGTGMGPGFFCAYPHPAYREPREVTNLDGTRQFIDAPTVFCRRVKEHPGDHAAFIVAISTPETWPNHLDEEPPF